MKAKPINDLLIDDLGESSSCGSSDQLRSVSLDFTQIYNEHKTWVRAVVFQIIGSKAKNEVLDDLVQEVFVRVWRGLSAFREDAKISSWIYRISVNSALDHLRAQGRQKESSDEGAVENALAPSGQDQATENRDIVEKGLATLSVEHRTVLILALLHELPLAEVASILDVSLGTVKSRLHYAKAEMRRFMKEKGVDL